MNQNKQLTTSNLEGNKTAVPVLMFEAANHTVPVQPTSNLTTQDQLCDDKDLVKVPHHAHRSTCWSPLNDF